MKRGDRGEIDSGKSSIQLIAASGTGPAA
jgi:hypothetical protein